MYIIINNTAHTLNMDAITLKSVKRDSVELPYIDPLPLSDVKSALIYCNVQPTQHPRLILMVEDSDGSVAKYPIKAVPDEIINIMDRLYADPNNHKTGLAPYWEGIWQGSYIGYRNMVQKRYDVLTMLAELTPNHADELKNLASVVLLEAPAAS